MSGRTSCAGTRHRSNRACALATNRQLASMASSEFVWKTVCTLLRMVRSFSPTRAHRLISRSGDWLVLDPPTIGRVNMDEDDEPRVVDEEPRIRKIILEQESAWNT